MRRGCSACSRRLVVLFTLLLPGRFDNYGTVQSMMFQLPELGLLALAMVIPLISGGLNLAIIATTNQCALLMAWIMSTWLPAGAGSMETAVVVAVALLAGLLLCTLIGLLTGFLVATMGVHPILVTLGTKSLIDGISIWLTRGTVVSGLPESFQWLGNGVLWARAGAVPGADPGRRSRSGLVLTRTSFGISIYMLGSNLEATRYSGVDTRRVSDRHLHALERALLRRRLPDAGPVQLGQRRLCPILSAGHHPGRRAGRGRPVRRLRADLRADAGADRAAGDLLGLQPARPQPAPDPGDLGPDPDRGDGRQVSRGTLGGGAPRPPPR